MYKPGPDNKAVDALSRVSETAELQTFISFPRWDEGTQPGFTYERGVLYYEDRLVISAQSSVIPKLLEEFHSSPMGGHSGFYRTYRRMAANGYWVGMKGRIQEFVQSCDVCQRQN